MNNELLLKKYSGSKLKEIRTLNSMTQQELAKKLTELKSKDEDSIAITRQTISKYENGERGMSLEMISDLSNIFKIPVTYFFPNQNSMESTLKEETTHYFSKKIIDDEGFSLEVKTAIPFEKLTLDEQKEIMDSAMEELMNLKKQIKGQG